jgi:hypothetical protein
MEDEQYLSRYPGMLPDGHDGTWLPGEETSAEPFALWHLRSPNGTQLAKAHADFAIPAPQLTRFLPTSLSASGQ